MRNAFLKTFLILFLAIFSISKSQNKETRIDSLIIEMSLDPGSGPDYNLIKLYFNKKDFQVKFIFYDGFDEEKYRTDSDLVEIRKGFQTNNENITESIRNKLRKVRLRHTKFYVQKIILKNKKNKEYLSKLEKVSNISQQDVENEKNKNASYIHGVWVSFYFYKNSEKKKLVASGLEKDNFGTFYSLLTNTLDLYRKQKQDKKFNNKTFGY